MNRLLLNFVKGLVLLVGIAMLVGGGLCSASIPFFAFQETRTVTWMIFALVVFLGGLIWLAISLRLYHQIKLLLLLASLLFLVGGGLCSTTSMTAARLGMFTGYAGLLLIDIAVALCGYILIRWIWTTWKKPSP